jgi:hypothetical protein
VAELPPALTEQVLPGGRVGGAIRVANTVRRPTGPWTPAVHALLAHLHSAGLDAIPEVLGIDDEGREVLTYIPGEAIGDAVSWPEWAADDDLLFEVGQWLRRFHDRVASFRPSGVMRWRNTERTLGPREIVCHHDVAPYNWVVGLVAGRPSLRAVIDWDMAGPGRPLDDVAFLSWNAIHSRAADAGREAKRMLLLADAYGADPRAVLGWVEPRARGAVRRIRQRAAGGDAGMQRLVAADVPGAVERSLADFVSRRPALAALIASEQP